MSSYEVARREEGRVTSRPTSLAEARLFRQASRALSRLELATAVRVAGAQAEAIVQTEKLREIDNLAREAMTGQAMLAKWRDTLAGSDPLLHDELRVFADLARLGKSEVIADTVSSFCRESRRPQ